MPNVRRILDGKVKGEANISMGRERLNGNPNEVVHWP